MPFTTEGGFSLLEMVLALSILGIIGAVLATVIIVTLSDSGAAGSVATNARDEQLFATYFQRDVESASFPINITPARLDCRDRGIDRLGPTHPVAAFRYADGNAVDYYWQLLPSSTVAARLDRRVCISSYRGFHFDSDDVLVHSLAVSDLTIAMQLSVPASCSTCLTASFGEDHLYSVTAGMRMSTTTTSTTTTSTTTTSTTVAAVDGG
jgi:prepilin-type N-terminal cleavage/methylation domain-containing protein